MTTTCPLCGATNSSGSKFCSQCATQLSSAAAAVDPGAARSVYTPPVMSMEPPRSSNATTILVLGILSLVVCAVLGPIAWGMGKAELERMQRGEVSQADHGTVNAGYICGIIGTVLLGLSVIFIGLAFAMPMMLR